MQTTISRFTVGDFIIEPLLNRITSRQKVTVVEPKVMHVLVCLARQPGEVFTKDALIEEVWEGTVVTDYVVSRSISQLRKIFDDSFKAPAYIETVSKTGYRLIAPVVEPGAADDSRTTDYGDSRPESATTIEVVPGIQIPELNQQTAVGSRWKVAALSVCAVFAGAVAAFVWINGGLAASQPLEPLPARLFTTMPGLEMYPRFSPDGSMVAYLRYDPDRRFDIYVKMVGAASEINLTDHVGSDIYPTWSPDGRFLAFQRVTEDACAIFKIPALGGTAQKLADCAVSQRHLDWSVDGTSFVTTKATSLLAPSHIALFDAESGAHTTVTTPPPAFSDFRPAFSPDGKQIAFCRGVHGEIADLHVVSVDGGEPRRLTFDYRNVAGFSWAPDSKSILFSSNRSGDFRLWRVAVADGELSWVSDIATMDPGSPSLSLDGKHLAYEEWTFELNVWAVDLTTPAADSNERFTSLFTSTRSDYQPQFSPDGQRVAFVSNRSGRHELWVGNSDGTAPAMLASLNGAYLHMPRWSPDGRFIAFDAFVDGRFGIYSVDALGGRPVLLTEGEASDRLPNWSADGKWIYFASNRDAGWQIWKMPAAGGTPERVTQHGGYLSQFSVDGGALYYSKLGESGIWSLVDGIETLVMPDLAQIDWGNWVADSTGIYRFDRKPDGVAVVHQSFDSNETRTISSFPHYKLSHESGITIAPDGRRLLLAHTDKSESDIMLVALR